MLGPTVEPTHNRSSSHGKIMIVGLVQVVTGGEVWQVPKSVPVPGGAGCGWYR